MKNWAHDVRKEISVMRMTQDTFAVQGRYTGGYYLYSLPQDTTQPAEVYYGRYIGGFFLYREPSYPPKYAVVYAIDRAPQDTFGVQVLVPPTYTVWIYSLPQDTTEPAEVYYGRYIGGFFLYRAPKDTFGVQYYPPRPGGYFLYSLPQDTTEPAEVYYGRYIGGFFLYRAPQDTTVPTPPPPPARITIRPLADRVLVEPAPAEERQIAYNAGVEGAIIVERRGNVLVVGNFTPTHVALPMPELELDPGKGPVCGWPVPEGKQPSAEGVQAKYTGYVLNQAIASGAGRPSGKTFGKMAGPISLPRPSDVGIPEFRMDGGGMPVLWPNGNPPRNPDWPLVGVVGIPVLEGIEGEGAGAGPGKPQNWCGTEYVWTGPRPKSPKLTLWPRPWLPHPPGR